MKNLRESALPLVVVDMVVEALEDLCRFRRDAADLSETDENATYGRKRDPRSMKERDADAVCHGLVGTCLENCRLSVSV